jgi:hypothetical protein
LLPLVRQLYAYCSHLNWNRRKDIGAPSILDVMSKKSRVLLGLRGMLRVLPITGDPALALAVVAVVGVVGSWVEEGVVSLVSVDLGYGVW